MDRLRRTNPYADFNGSGTLEERYLFGPGVVNGAVVDEMLARTSSGGTTAWYLTDKLGSVRDIVSSSGTELDHIVYDSFGNILTETNATNGDRFKYAGMEYDSATGQYYDRARTYDPVTGRFTSQDPTGFGAGDGDLYRYVSNDPLSYTDPTGNQQVPVPPLDGKNHVTRLQAFNYNDFMAQYEALQTKWAAANRPLAKMQSVAKYNQAVGDAAQQARNVFFRSSSHSVV